jgi:hypothetical protein
VVSPRSARYNVELGRYLRNIEERLFNSLAKMFGHKTVIKGMNSRQSATCMRQKWHMFKKPIAVGLDASRFDQHVSVQALQWEHDVYLSCFPRKKHKRQLAGLLREQLNNKCVGYSDDGRLKYKVEGCRMSGDMNTSLGNCVLMCSMIKAYALHVGVSVQLANNGDDCVVFMESSDYARFSEDLDGWFRKVGFNMVVEKPCRTFEEIEFCQTHPVWLGPDHDDYIMVRHPVKAISKDTVRLNPDNSAGPFSGWLHSVGTGGLSATGSIPVFQEFYKSFLRNGKYDRRVVDGQSWGVAALHKNMQTTLGDPSPLTRASFYWAFGITPDEQLCIEKFYTQFRMDCSVKTTQLHFQPSLPT